MIKKLLILTLLILGISGLSFAQPATSTAPAKSDTAKPKAFRPTKSQIKDGQAFLKDSKHFSGEATGVYSDATRKAISQYQKENGLESNGKFDKPTLEKMGISTEPKPSDTAAASEKSTSTTVKATTGSTAKRPAPFQATKDQIIALQKALTGAKLYAGATDGERSEALKDSIKKYQQANELKVTGTINAATIEKMGIPLTDKQKEQVAAQAAYDAAKTPKE